jgi:hypothetical protein
MTYPHTTGQPVAPCVRCGRRPRAVSGGALTFLCRVCLDDPTTHEEVAEGLRAKGSDGSAARRYMRDRFDWVGGWPRLDR